MGFDICKNIFACLFSVCNVPASSITAEIYMQAYECTAITLALHPPKVWERFVDDIYNILRRMYLENFFHHINNLHQNIKVTMEEE